MRGRPVLAAEVMAVVVPVASADQGSLVAQGAKLASAFEEELHVIHVIDTDQASEDIGTTSDRSKVALKEIASSRADDAVDGVDYRGPVVTTGLSGEDPASRIVAYATDEDATYLVIGGRKRSPVGKALFGSVAQQVLLNAPCPVLSVRE